MRAGLESLVQRLGLAATPAQVEATLAYAALLQRWGAVYNLTAIRDDDAVLHQHLADCLAVLPPLQREQPGPARVLDVGSGGGLPGVLFAIWRPDLQVTCVDAVAKKTAFVRQASGTLALDNLRAQHARVETLGGHGFDLITARAFASLGDLARCSGNALAPQGRWLAMKGQRPDAEIAALPASIDVFHVERLEVPGLGAERHLIWMRYARQP